MHDEKSLGFIYHFSEVILLIISEWLAVCKLLAH